RTALFVGSGADSLLKDALVQRDHQGFPMIRGSSLTGVLRHALETEDVGTWSRFFGYQAEKEGLGSQLKISSAYLVLEDGRTSEGLSSLGREHLPKFEDLPQRQHVRMTHKGVAADGGKFDNEVVNQGCRFLFEMELVGTGGEREKAHWKRLLDQVHSPLFRLGQGTRNGYGQLSVHSCCERCFDLKKVEDFDAYLNYQPSFQQTNDCLHLYEFKDSAADDKALQHYRLELWPDAFFHFGAGYGDEKVDRVPVREEVVRYEEGSLSFEERSLIPASSIKGALRHRCCYHYNRLREEEVWAEEIDDPTPYIGVQNEAVRTLFGAESGGAIEDAHQGRVLLNDLHPKEMTNDKIFNHVAIDRFTGGAKDGALFSEKTSQWMGEKPLVIDLWVVHWKQFSSHIQDAFEESLKDICRGLLPLGGMGTKGHGVFQGSLFINDKKHFPDAD
ncbi:MAG: RAMP superfamily CRISPR-associated protein, partial [Bacteroidota bacterium]